MYNNKKISLIFPVYNEEDNIENAIIDAKNLNVFDEIIVVDNNSTDKSKEIILKNSVKYYLETTQGYGAAIRRGMNESNGDLLVICEPDGSFDIKDTIKLLDLTKKYDCVFGSRTYKNYIEKKAKMQFALRYGNIIVAKFLSILFNTMNFTDVGCTFKIISRFAYLKIYRNLKVNGSELQPEIMINLILQKLKIIEVPVNYKERIGKSKITKDIFSTTILAIKMVILMIEIRFKKKKP